MGYLQKSLRILIFVVSLTQDDTAQANVNDVIIHDINATTAALECNTRVILRCYQHALFNHVYWQINNRANLGTRLSVQCFAGTGCVTYNNFTGRYTFGYNSSTGISDLTIFPVTMEDSGEYTCTEGFRDTRLTAFVKSEYRRLISLHNKTSAEGSLITFYLGIDCTDVNFTITWHSTAMDGTDDQTHTASSFTETECLAGNCVYPGTSKNSSLELENLTHNKGVGNKAVGEARHFRLNISSSSSTMILFLQGLYKTKETPFCNAGEAKSLSTSATVGITCAAVLSIEISVVFTVKCVRRKRNGKRNNPNTTEVAVNTVL